MVELHDRLPPERWQAPLDLAIDEFQNISGGGSTPAAKLLQSMHEANNNLPVLLVLGGLGNTIDLATEYGLTRGLSTIGIGCLSGDEAEGLVHGWCRHYGMNTQGHAHRISKFAASTHGWPRHLHFALKALTKNLVQLAVHTGLEEVDWHGVKDSNLQLRQRYYHSCMSPQMEESAHLVGAVMRDLREGHRRGDVINSLERHSGSRPGSRWRLPEGMTVEGLTRHLIHRGALQKYEDGTVDCPIPSFQSWLINQGTPAPSPKLDPDSSPDLNM